MNKDSYPILELIRSSFKIMQRIGQPRERNKQQSMTDVFNEKICWLMPWNAKKVAEIWAKGLRCKFICNYNNLLELLGYLDIVFNFSKSIKIILFVRAEYF